MTDHDALTVRPGPHPLNGGRKLLEGGRVGAPGQPDPKEHRTSHQA